LTPFFVIINLWQEGAVAGNKGNRTEHTLETDNKITLTFGGNYVLPFALISSDLFDSSAF